jgi:CRISPR-associated endonuclease Cas1
MATREPTATKPSGTATENPAGDGAAPGAGAYAVELSHEDIADATEARAATYGRDLPGNVVVASGRGLAVKVERGALVIEDGDMDQHRERRFEKVAPPARVAVLAASSSGFVSLDALTWCRRAGVPVVMLDLDGSPTFANAYLSLDDARLRRAQALAAGSEVGLGIVRRLLEAKLGGHAAIARDVLGDARAADIVEGFRDGLGLIDDVEGARRLEAQAAAAYFGAWPTVDVVRFVAKDAPRVPPHWRRFNGRRSALRLGNSNQRSERPVNSLLNFLYRVAETETRTALLTVGLDPGLGLLHTDYPGRDSLALDALEPIRPHVERYVLRLLDEHRFRKADFVELPDGHVRIRGPLIHELLQTAPTWAEVVAPHVEMIAHSLAEVVPGRIVKRTPLTSTRRKAAQRSIRPSQRREPSPRLLPTCHGCGAQLDRPDYTWCATCLPAVKHQAIVKAGKRSAAVRQVRKAAGLPDPTTTPEARAKLGAAIGRRDAEALAWEAAHPGVVADPESFGLIASGLRVVTLGKITAATGLSKNYVAQVRKGEYVPHPRHWPTLAELAGVPCPFENGADAGGLDVTWWREVVMPALAAVTTTAISHATGLSSGQASKVRRGLNVPHPRHWPALAELAGVEVPAVVAR